MLLAQLIANLLDNALSYSEGPIELSVSAHAHALEVCVKDRGPGLSDAQQASLFAPHVRGDHPGVRGAGLGLAVCKAIAEAHGARSRTGAAAAGAAGFRCCCPWKARNRPGRPHDLARAGGRGRPRNPLPDAVLAVGRGL